MTEQETEAHRERRSRYLDVLAVVPDGTPEAHLKGIGRDERQAPCQSAERDFVAEAAQVRAARAWLREVLPAACPVRDDCTTILSELLANCAEHGGGGRVSVTVAHGRGRVSGRLVHHMPPQDSPRTCPATAGQTARLLSGEVLDEGEELAENGRGLLVVRHLADSYSYAPGVTRSAFHWELTGCACERERPCPA